MVVNNLLDTLNKMENKFEKDFQNILEDPKLGQELGPDELAVYSAGHAEPYSPCLCVKSHPGALFCVNSLVCTIAVVYVKSLCRSCL